MNSRSRKTLADPEGGLRYLERELEGVEVLLQKLRHNRGRWPRKWVNGMLRHYENRRAKLRDQISRWRKRNSRTRD